LVQAQPAVPDDLQLVPASQLPQFATWWCLEGLNLPPAPGNWCAGEAGVSYYMSPSLGAGTVFVDDPAADAFFAAPSGAETDAQGMEPLAGGSGPPTPPPNGGIRNGGGSQWSPPQWSTAPGTLEILADTNHPGNAFLIL
jgi:hypothetical protein